MTVGLATRGYIGGSGGSDGPLTPPTIDNITPAHDVAAGTPGAFDVNYSIARNTPVQFDLTNIVAGAGVTISVKFQHRNETYVALDHEGTWQWPFDAFSTIGDLGLEPVHVSLLPRDGWPPVPFAIKVAAVKPAVES
jgi:hypothetical protein